MYLKLNRENLLEYIDKFDYIKEKYSLNEEDFNKVEFYDVYRDLEDHERSEHPITLPQREYSTTYDNVKMIYAQDDIARDMMELFDRTRENVVRNFININGIERLFSEKYFDYEWDMHTRLRYDDGSRDYYRDHFIHQIRVFFGIMTLLDNTRTNFMQEAQVCIKSNNSDVIPIYINNAVKKYIYEIKMYDDVDEYYKSILLCEKVLKKKVDIQDDMSAKKQESRSIKALIKEQERRLKEELKKYHASDLHDFINSKVIMYFIKLSCTMAALFHDIGYPIEHGIKSNERLTEYISLLHKFTGSSDNFDSIASLLDSSLLFKIVPRNEIKDRLIKKDHGVYSALTFLLHFYENGSSDGLRDTLKHAAAEVAAVAIYDHNIKYLLTSKSSDMTNYYKPYFKKNPVSFLLRLCDDLQEWDRVYFDYKYTPGMRLCDMCKTPIVSVSTPRNKGKERDRYGLESNWLELHKRVCLCSKNPDGVVAGKRTQNCYDIIKNIDFPNFAFKRKKVSDLIVQKITIVSTCDDMIIKHPEEKPTQLTIELKYLPFKLLQMCYTSAVFTKFKIETLNCLKKLLDRQFNMTNVKLNYFITSNPLMLKAKIIDDYEKLNPKRKIVDVIDTIYKPDDMSKLLSRGSKQKYINAMKQLKDTVVKRYYIYKAMNDYYKKLRTNESDAEEYWESNVWNKVNRTIPQEMLLFDMKVQYSRLADSEDYENNYDSYTSLFEANYKRDAEKEKNWEKGIYKKYKNMAEDYFYNMVASYCSPEVSPYRLYENDLLEDSEDNVTLDFYTDFELFRILASYIDNTSDVNNSTSPQLRQDSFSSACNATV